MIWQCFFRGRLVRNAGIDPLQHKTQSTVAQDAARHSHLHTHIHHRQLLPYYRNVGSRTTRGDGELSVDEWVMNTSRLTRQTQVVVAVFQQQEDNHSSHHQHDEDLLLVEMQRYVEDLSDDHDSDEIQHAFAVWDARADPRFAAAAASSKIDADAGAGIAAALVIAECHTSDQLATCFDTDEGQVRVLFSWIIHFLTMGLTIHRLLKRPH